MATFPHVVTIQNVHTALTKKTIVWASDAWSAESFATLADWIAIDSRLAELGEF